MINFIPQQTLDYYCSVSSAHYFPNGKINEIINYNNKKYIITVHCSSTSKGNVWCMARKVIPFESCTTEEKNTLQILTYKTAKYIKSTEKPITFKSLDIGSQLQLF